MSDLVRTQATRVPSVALNASGGRRAIESAAGPLVIRGVGRHWPAIRLWSLDYLARVGGSRPVTVVEGNRELGSTTLTRTTLAACMRRFEADNLADTLEIAHLKEFDILRELPQLANDFDRTALFPRGHIVASSAWIGPRGAHTGLHYDYLDNLAVVMHGAKRFFLLAPGHVEALGAVSRKFDRWARLASIGIVDLISRPSSQIDVFFADLEPGDALYIPRGWWHEVVNLRPSILLSGFFGPPWRVLPLWLMTGMFQLAHNASPRSRRACTCHPSRQDQEARPQPAPR